MEANQIWAKYEKAKDYHLQINLLENTNKYHDFYIGNQWRNISDPETLPVYNIIQPIVEYKTATVAQNSMAIMFSPFDNNEAYIKACDHLNRHADMCWELGKMDTMLWQAVKDSCIAGDSYLYFYDSKGRCQLIDRTSMFFADEQQQDIQKQQWIIIWERRDVSEVKAEAKQNGVADDQIDLIVADDDTDNSLGDKKEVKTDSGKCSCLLYLSKKDGVVTRTRATKHVIYQPEYAVEGKDSEGKTVSKMSLYPIVKLVWMPLKGSLRGVGEVKQLIPNQISINKTLARREEAIKNCAYPKLVYDGSAVQNKDQLDMTDVKIEIESGGTNGIRNFIDYLNPVPLSSDAKALTDELITQTRDLAGAGDAATGQINPEQASGAAIAAAVAQAQLPLNEQISTEKQAIEDIAHIWWDIWVAYNPNGLEVSYQEDGKTVKYMIPPEILSQMRVNIRVDVAPNTPQSQLAQDTELRTLMDGGKITFEEFVEALGDKSHYPKGKLQDILRKRTEDIPQEVMEAVKNPEIQQIVLQLMGGMTDGAMPTMPDSDPMLQQGYQDQGQFAV